MGQHPFLGAAIVLLMTDVPALAQDNQALVARGSYLVEGIAACGVCHLGRDASGAPAPERGLSGGAVLTTPAFKARMPNITPDPETGIGRWSDADFVRAMREGIRPDGTVIGPPMPIAFYRQIGDADLAAIVSYLRAQPAIRNKVEKSEYKKPLPSNYGPPIESPVVSPPLDDPVRYGEYLAGPLGHCMLCHTQREPDGRPDPLKWGAGGVIYRGPAGVAISRNLTAHESGLRDWSDVEIERAIREGVRKDGTKLKPPMPYREYQRIDERDMKALIAYLRSLPPKPFAAPAEPLPKQ